MNFANYTITVGVLALQGAFSEHSQLLRQAFTVLERENGDQVQWRCVEVRTTEQLANVDALIVPGGERCVELVSCKFIMLSLP